MIKNSIAFCLIVIFSITTNAQGVFDAIRNNDLHQVKELIEKHPDLVNTPGNNRFTPILFAANNNKSEIAEYLISKGADVDAVFLADYYGNTPISFAIKNNNLDLVKILLNNGADIQHRTKLGENYLHFAAAQNMVDIAEYLINNGIDINSVKNGGLTPLHLAVITGSVDAVKLLIEKEANLDIRSNDNGTPLHYALATRNNEIADILREKGAIDLPREFPEYKGQYLGKTPPGDEPEPFAPELFRDLYRSYGTPTFSPDGKELFFYGYFMPGIGYKKTEDGLLLSWLLFQTILHGVLLFHTMERDCTFLPGYQLMVNRHQQMICGMLKKRMENGVSQKIPVSLLTGKILMKWIRS
jgi:hypothetical protein